MEVLQEWNATCTSLGGRIIFLDTYGKEECVEEGLVPDYNIAMAPECFANSCTDEEIIELVDLQFDECTSSEFSDLTFYSKPPKGYNWIWAEEGGMSKKTFQGYKSRQVRKGNDISGT
ncbi:predicted protein [Chaetoceros tenuissimus]|uniref:Uncharacterized protein n=1 Tax=Chaetoceros tenuissimus TaxID=426638 RepID=A0AAD3D2T6_9STRA|nr:predicted protein [Chaetoceros tenuissimus]